MGSKILLAVFSLLLAVSISSGQRRPGTAPASSPRGGGTELSDLLRQLISELQQLRIELLEQRLQQQQGGISRLEEEIRQARAEAEGLNDQDRALASEIAELDEQIAQSGGVERVELEGSKARLAASGPEKTRARKSASARREAELSDRLQQEQSLRVQLLERVRRLAAESGEPARH